MICSNIIFKVVNYKNAMHIEPEQEIFCEGFCACLKLKEKLNKKGIDTRIECNEDNMWSVFIESVPYETNM